MIKNGKNTIKREINTILNKNLQIKITRRIYYDLLFEY